MTTTVQTYIEAIQDKIRVIDGIQAAPELITDSVKVFPFVVAWPGPSSIEHGTPGSMKFMESIIIELHVARKHLPNDYQRIVRYTYEIPNAIWNAIRETVAFRNVTCSGLISLSYGSQGEVPTLGFRWTINDVKTMSDCT